MAGSTVAAYGFWTAEAIAYVSIVLTVAAMWHRRHRDGAPVAPRGSLTVLVPVCGEPAEMVEHTLAAALAISYPHDVWC